MGYYRTSTFGAILSILKYILLALSIIIYDFYTFYLLIKGDWEHIDIFYSIVSIGFSVMILSFIYDINKNKKLNKNNKG